MPTRSIDLEPNGDALSPSKKKQKVTSAASALATTTQPLNNNDDEEHNLDFSHVLLECGIKVIAGGEKEGDSNSNITSASLTKAGSTLDEDVTPQSLRVSLHGLLSEMHKSGIDVDNALVLESMEELISSGAFGSGNDDSEDNEDEVAGEKVKNALLYKLLLPMTGTSTSNSSTSMGFTQTQASQSELLSQDLLAGNDNASKINDSNQQNPDVPKVQNFDASLIKILLRVDALQPTLLNCLLGKLQEIATDSNNDDDMDMNINTIDLYSCNEEIPRLILSHIRWLGNIVDPITLIQASLECLSVLCTNLSDSSEEADKNSASGSGDSMTRTILLDLIATLPDIVDEGSTTQDPDLMESILSTLRDIRIQDPKLLIPCLDAVSSLQLDNVQVEGVLEDALEAVEGVTGTEMWLLPALSKFLVQNVPRKDGALCRRVIDTFRRLRLGIEDDEDAMEDRRMISNANTNSNHNQRSQIHDKTDSEALMLEALSQGFTYRVDLTNALISTLKSTIPSQHGAADVWLLLCCGVAAHNKTKVNPLVKAKAASGGFTRLLLADAIQGNGAALFGLFHTSMLPLADFLVRSKDPAARALGGNLYEELFLEFVDRAQRQEIVGQLVIHIASGLSYEEIDVAMMVFSNVVTNTRNGPQSLQLFLPFLVSLLDNVQNFKPPHLRRLFMILFTVGGGDGDDNGDAMNGGSGIDEVQILINKFLAMPNAVKQIGIIGVVAYASCMGERASPQKVKEVLQMLELVHKSCLAQVTNKINLYWSAVDVSQSFMSMFFDELCLAMMACSLPHRVKTWILDQFSGALEDEFLGDLENADTFLSSDSRPRTTKLAVKDKEDKAMIDGSSNNVRAPKAELRYNIDKEDAVVYLKLLSLHASDDLRKREILPQQLCPLLRLLTVANDERYEGEGIGNIDALLGCPMLLPDPASSSIDFTHLSEHKKKTVAASLFTAVSWCREIINSFIYSAAFRPPDSNDSQLTQEQDCTRDKVVEKLKCLLDLEEDLLLCAKKCYSFTPPGTAPLSTPRDISNVTGTDIANATVDYAENEENDDPDRMTAEEKKALKAIKLAAKKEVAAKMKSKQKLLKTKQKYESTLESRTYDALRPLSPYVSLALGFPELRVGGSNVSSSQELILSLGASELKHVKVGDEITNTLLKLLNTSFKDSTLYEGLGENPYVMGCIDKNKNIIATSEFDFLNLCIDGNVFLSMHERLVAAAEIIGSSESGDETITKDTLKCTQLQLQCITTLIEIKNPVFRDKYFEAIMKQFADGEPIRANLLRSKNANANRTFIRSAAALFDLLEEVVTGSDTADLAYTMVGVESVDALVRRASTYDATKPTAKAHLLKMNTKLSKLCIGLLRREWHDGTTLNKSNVGKLVALYLEYSTLPCPDVNDPEFDELKWGRLNAINVLIKEAMLELPSTPDCKGPVASFPTCSRATFSHFLAPVLSTITNEFALVFQEPIAKSDTSTLACLAVVRKLISMTTEVFYLSKNNTPLTKSSLLLTQLKIGTKFISVILKHAIPYFTRHFEAHEDAIIELLEMPQKITRQINFILVFGKRSKDSNLVREGPKVRKICEEYIHKVKGLLKKAGIISAMWGGTLKNRNIDGSKIIDSSESEEDDQEEDENNSDGDSEGGQSSGTESEED